MERCVCAPHSDLGGMDSEPKESDSMRDGSEAMALLASSEDDDASGRIEERTPGVNVAGANTCFMVMLCFGFWLAITSCFRCSFDGCVGQNRQTKILRQNVGISTSFCCLTTTNHPNFQRQRPSSITSCTTMGAKKSKSGKKGPKGKKARAKAKLEQVWGEHVDEEARRQSKHRVGKSRFLSDSNNNSSHAKQQRHNKNEKEVDPLSRNRRGLKSSFETFLERKDKLYQNDHEERQKNYYAQKKNIKYNTVNNNDGKSSSSSSGSDDDDSESEIDESGVNNNGVGGGSLSYLLKRIKGPKKSSSRKVVAAESDDDDDVSHGSDDSNDDDADSVTSSTSSSQDDFNSESDVDMDSAEDEVEGYDVDIIMPKGAAADPYEAHFSKQPLPQIDSTESTKNNKSNNNLTPLIGKSVKVDTSSLLSSSMQVHLSGPLLDSYEALVDSIPKKVKSKHTWRAFTRGPQKHIRQVLGRNWNTINQSALKRGRQRGERNSEQQGENEIRFSPLQQVLYPALSRYADVMISMETRQVRASFNLWVFRLPLIFM